jgi:flavin reductase (DIM6/NTAB) family NADH-FMN oxidoreductase RutF
MARKEVRSFKYVKEMNRLLKRDGLFLVSSGKDIKPNVMTIGCGFLGTMWSMPIFIVAVRHSRYTFKLMEESPSWTVCLPAKGMEGVLEFCGEKSGRDADKFKEMKLTAKNGVAVKAPHIDECPVHFECETIFKTDMLPGQLKEDIEGKIYKSKDMHMIYFGQLKGCYEVEDAKKKLAR